MTESQLLLLNNLIYRPEFSQYSSQGYTVREILELARRNNSHTQQEMTPEEWEDIFKLADRDKDILDLKITSTCEESETGARMACFEDPSGNAYAVFAGTGANEWRDDCVAGTMADSPQQEKALEWINSLPYDNITVSGHSKGGNKAMYVAVVSDKVSECYAFDGEGFSNEFCQKYEQEIAEKKDRIHLRAHRRDFVNILLNCIAGDVKYVNNEVGIDNAAQYHCPNALFGYQNGKPTGEIGELTDQQDPAMEMFHNFSVYLLNHAPKVEKVLALSVLGEILTQYLGGKNGIVREDIIALFGVEGIEIVLRYLTKYLQDLMITDPKTYLKYRTYFSLFADDAPGGFWSYFLSVLTLITGGVISPGMLFDSLVRGSALRLYRTAEAFIGGNVRGRDFSQEARTIMLNAAKETEEEPWWRIDRWDCWYKIEKSFGGMKWDQYTGKVDKYYRKLIDINDASRKDIERIFDTVYSLDESYSREITSSQETYITPVVNKFHELQMGITPKKSH